MIQMAGLEALIVGAGNLQVKDVTSSSPGAGELLIHPDAVGICGTDLELLSGEMAYLRSGLAQYPIVPGHEWTGIVHQVGDDVEDFTKGDRVVGECSIGCGACSWCLSGRYHLCPDRTETGIVGRRGALATTLMFPSRAAHRVPSTVSAADAALVEPAAVAYRAVSRLGLDKRATDEIGLVGAGTIGILCALTARALDLGDPVIFDIDPDRQEFAAELGFRVERELPRKGFPYVLEASGSPTGVAFAFDLCREGGSLVLAGLTGCPTAAVHLDGIVVRDQTIRGTLGSPGVWPTVISLIVDGLIRPSRLVTHEFPLTDVANAFELAGSHKAGVRKILIHPN